MDVNELSSFSSVRKCFVSIQLNWMCWITARRDVERQSTTNRRWKDDESTFYDIWYRATCDTIHIEASNCYCCWVCQTTKDIIMPHKKMTNYSSTLNMSRWIGVFASYANFDILRGWFLSSLFTTDRFHTKSKPFTDAIEIHYSCTNSQTKPKLFEWHQKMNTSNSLSETQICSNTWIFLNAETNTILLNCIVIN